jgi:imidazolonepropionase-like amidohydrolase
MRGVWCGVSGALRENAKALRWGAVAICLTFVAFPVAAANKQCAPGSPVLFTDANVLSMTNQQVARNQSVLVRAGRIERIAPNLQAPSNACRIDARGKTLMPGLADMHVHMSPSDVPLLLANGVTLAREMNGTPALVALRDSIASGKVFGPRLLVASPLLAGVPQRWRHRLVTSAQDAYAAAHDAKAAGYDYLKIYDGLSAEAYAALVEAGHTLGLPLDGHIPQAVGLEGVLAAGQTIEHMDKIVSAISGGAGLDTTRIASARALFRKYGVWLTPTLSSLKALDMAGTPAYTTRLAGPDMAYVDSATLAFWRAFGRPRDRAAGPTRYYQYEVKLLAGLHEDSLPMLLGTDTANPLMVAGFAVHEELAVLTRDAGFSNFEALRTATSNVGRFLHEPTTGTLQVGAAADLVLVAGDPLLDLGLLRRPAGVMVKGVWLDRSQLDGMLASARVR